MVSDALRPLPWQQALWLDLTGQWLAGRLHHALLLAGPQGVGKRHFARALAAFMVCEQRAGEAQGRASAASAGRTGAAEAQGRVSAAGAGRASAAGAGRAGAAYACGGCRSCQQFAAGTQPNASLLSVDGHLALSLAARPEQALVHWEPDKDSKRRDIVIDAVRSLIAQFALTSHHGQNRVALVEPVEKLNASGVNALLKTIEEPPPGTYLLLLSEQPNLLKPTLRSRCQRLRLAAPAREQALEWLRAQGVTDPAPLLEEAGGAPLRALEWQRGDARQLQAQWREWLQKLAEHKAEPLGVSADIGKADAPGFLSWLSGWITLRLRSVPPGSSVQALARFATAVTESQRRLEGNVKPELVLDALLIQWWNLHKPRRAA